MIGEPQKSIRDFLVIHPDQKKNLAIRKGKCIYISEQNGGGFTGTKIGDHNWEGQRLL